MLIFMPIRCGWPRTAEVRFPHQRTSNGGGPIRHGPQNAEENRYFRIAPSLVIPLQYPKAPPPPAIYRHACTSVATSGATLSGRFRAGPVLGTQPASSQGTHKPLPKTQSRRGYATLASPTGLRPAPIPHVRALALQLRESHVVHEGGRWVAYGLSHQPCWRVPRYH